MELVLLVDDRIDSEMLLGDGIISEDVRTVFHLVACNLISIRRCTTSVRLYQFELLFQDKSESLCATIRR
jgi:hypothetical protein